MGRLAIMDEHGVPSMAPVCFVLEGQTVFLAKDDFPEGISLLREQQMDALAGNPNMALMVDHWEENLNRIGVVLMRGMGEVLPGPGLEQRRVLSLFRDKYAQYRGINMKDDPVIRMDLFSLRHWGDLSGIRPSGGEAS